MITNLRYADDSILLATWEAELQELVDRLDRVSRKYSLVWPVATYGCVSWTLRKNEETRLDAFEMKGRRRILRVLWTANKTNEWVLNKAGVHHQSKEASILWSHHQETRELPEGRDNARNNARCTKARKATHGLDGQHQDMDRTLRGSMTEDRDK